MNEPRKTALTIAVLMVIMLLALAVEWLLEKSARWLLFGISVVAVVILLGIHFALAHDHGRPELDGWFMSLRSGKGPCCDGSDAMSIDDPASSSALCDSLGVRY